MQVRITVAGDSGLWLCCCVCVTSFKCLLTPLRVDCARALWASLCFRLSNLRAFRKILHWFQIKLKNKMSYFLGALIGLMHRKCAQTAQRQTSNGAWHMTPELWHLTLQGRLVLCWGKGLTVNIWWRRPGNLTTSTVCILVRVTSNKNFTYSGKTKIVPRLYWWIMKRLYLSFSTSSETIIYYHNQKIFLKVFLPSLFPSQHSVVTGFQTMKETGRWNRKTQMFGLTGCKTSTYLLTHSPLLV